MNEHINFVLDDVRNVPSVSLDEFQQSFLPQVVSSVQIDAIAARLRTNGSLQPNGRWTLPYRPIPDQRKPHFLKVGAGSLYLMATMRCVALACDCAKIEEYNWQLKDTWEDESGVGRSDAARIVLNGAYKSAEDQKDFPQYDHFANLFEKWEDEVDWTPDGLKEENYADFDPPENDADNSGECISSKGSVANKSIDKVDEEISNEGRGTKLRRTGRHNDTSADRQAGSTRGRSTRSNPRTVKSVGNQNVKKRKKA
ncbi:hypothetical protein EV421DRAFT_1734748 [Armillaria borealis]|uniref:Uncharacterized protein n=1 Tax=Armillaria borealis TaxID=47425 RepID=A0AA39JS38_9AGAR|nr:hypothetical protein EV421DRAFT_1734748 [Armillaria borealis]